MSRLSKAFPGGLVRTLAAVLWFGTAAFAATPAPAPPPAEEITGTLQDTAGGGIPNARVTALLPGRSQGVTTVTGASGAFTISLPLGRYELVVKADGFEESRTALTVSEGQARAPLSLVLQLAGQRQVIEVTESMNYQAVVSSAIKAPTPLQDVPQAISVVSRDLIRDQSMQSMADVVRYVPGITMAQGEGHRDAPVIRGNVTTSDFYVNGVRDDVQYYRDLYNVERIEAVKGANAMTFGQIGRASCRERV